MKEKLKLSLVVILMMTMTTLWGCGSHSTNNTSGNLSEPQTYKPGKKVMSCMDGNPGVQIGDTYLEVGKATLQDFIDAGAEMLPGTIVKEPTYMMNPNDYETVHLVYYQTELGLSVTNDSNQLQAISKGIVYNINAEKGADVLAPGGVRVGDSIENLNSIFGEPLKVETPNRDEFSYKYGNKQGSPSTTFYAMRNNPDIISGFTVYMPKLLVENEDDINNIIIQSMMAAYENYQDALIYNVFDSIEATGEAYGKKNGEVEGTVENKPLWDKLLLCKVKDGVEVADNSTNETYTQSSVFLIATYSQDIVTSEETRNWYKKQYGKDVRPSYTAYGAVVFGNPVYNQETGKLEGKVLQNLTPLAPMTSILYMNEDSALQTLLTGDTFGRNYTFPKSRTLDDYKITTISLKKYN